MEFMNIGRKHYVFRQRHDYSITINMQVHGNEKKKKKG